MDPGMLPRSASPLFFELTPMNRFQFTLAVGSLLLGGFASESLAQNTTVAVSFKRVIRQDGTSPPAWSNAAINTMLADANVILGTAGITLVQEGPVIDWLDPAYPFSYYNVDVGAVLPGTLTGFRMAAYEQAAETSPVRYAWSTTAINVYLVNTIAGLQGICSFPPPLFSNNMDDIVFLAGQTNPAISDGRVLAHELGHYFGLFHTFEANALLNGPETLVPCGPSPDGATAGDLVVDTFANPTGGTRNLALLNANHDPATCPGANSDLANNVMSLYDILPSTAAYFTAGQAARMASFANGIRYQVRQTGLPINGPVLSGAAASGTTITLTGLALQPPFLPTLFPVTVGLGQSFCSGLGTAAPACVAELVSNPTTAWSYTTITASFPGPIPPGDHTVNLYYGGDLVASLPNGLQVGPSIEHTVANPFTSDVRDRFRSASGGATNMLVAVGPETPPTPFGGGNLRVDLASPVTLTFTVPVPATGISDVFYPLRALPAASSFAVQALDLTSNTITNMIRISGE